MSAWLQSLARLLALALVASGIGCGDDVAGNVGTEKVTLSFGPQSINGDSVVGEADFFQPTFLEAARASLGRDLEGLEVTKLELVRIGGATGLNGWSDLFSSDLRIFLETPSGGSFLTAEGEAPAGFGTLSLPLKPTRDQLSGSADALAGKLSVYLVAKAGRNETDFFSVNAEVRVTFAAY